MEHSWTVSVVICAYTLDRWSDLAAAMASVAAQTIPESAETILVIDHNNGLQRRAETEWPTVRVISNTGPRGLSGARNSGVAMASGEVVAFLDDDAAAESGWLSRLIAPFETPEVFATGGAVVPTWDGGRPRWFPPAFDWVVGCSYEGLPERTAPVRNPIGASMAIRRAAILAAGGFRADVGRVGRAATGGDETELCIRIRAGWPDGVVLYVPDARVRHRVPRARGTFRYFASRCYQEGRSKARITALRGAGAALASERRYATRTLPLGIARGARDALRRDPWGLARAAAIVIGLGLTTLGYVAGRVGVHPLPASEPGRTRRSAP